MIGWLIDGRWNGGCAISGCAFHFCALSWCALPWSVGCGFHGCVMPVWEFIAWIAGCVGADCRQGVEHGGGWLAWCGAPPPCALPDACDARDRCAVGKGCRMHGADVTVGRAGAWWVLWMPIVGSYRIVEIGSSRVWKTYRQVLCLKNAQMNLKCNWWSKLNCVTPHYMLTNILNDRGTKHRWHEHTYCNW
jgi:hypothetical protein